MKTKDQIARKSGKRPRTIYIRVELDRRLRTYAAEQDLPVSTVIDQALERFLKARKA